MKERSVACPRERGQLTVHAQPCDVLGPQACADCIKVRRRRRLQDQANGTFPGLDTDQRSLCWPRRVKAIISPRRLPPLLSERSTNSGRYSLPGKKLSSRTQEAPSASGEKHSTGVNYGDYGNIRLATDYTKAHTETFSAVRRKRQPGAVSEPELHQRVMRNRRRRNQLSQITMHGETEGTELETKTPPPLQRTVTIVLPSESMDT